jgi:glycosyltransferase involved in cell wall biosynthesis
VTALTPWICPGCNYRWRVDPERFPFNCANCRREALAYTPTPPDLLARAFNLGKDTALHVASGRVLVSDLVREFRQAQCLRCELFNHDLRVCTHRSCGCAMRSDRGWFDALGWATKICPIGRWDNPPTPEPLIFSLYRKPPESRATSIGLGVNSQLTASALRQNGIDALAAAITGGEELRRLLELYTTAQIVVVEGFWISPDELAAIAADYPRVQFLARCHSQIAFLQIEPGSLCRIRDVLTHSQRLANLRLSGNSRRFTEFASEAWAGDPSGGQVVYLPNLYPTPAFTPEAKPPIGDRPLKLASFGALRLQKHHTVAAAAAAIVARRLGPVQFFINRGRSDPGRESIFDAIAYTLKGVPQIELKPVDWLHAAEFRRLTAAMDLCLQMSSSETFNLVTADAAASGVPSVVGEALDWTPADWHAPIDDPRRVAEAALRVLADPTAGQRGYEALLAYNRASIAQWQAVVSA